MSTPTAHQGPADGGHRTARPGIPWWSMLAGVIGGVVLLAVAELASLAFSSSSAPFVAVGGGFIDIIPPSECVLITSFVSRIAVSSGGSVMINASEPSTYMGDG